MGGCDPDNPQSPSRSEADSGRHKRCASCEGLSCTGCARCRCEALAFVEWAPLGGGDHYRCPRASDLLHSVASSRPSPPSGGTGLLFSTAFGLVDMGLNAARSSNGVALARLYPPTKA